MSELYELDDSSDEENSSQEVESASDVGTASGEDSHVYDVQEIYIMMEREIAKILEIAHLPKNRVRALLNLFKWDSEKLLDLYYEKGEAALIRSDWIVPADIRNSFDCQICCDELTATNTIRKLQCNHVFCNDCLSCYLVTIISEESGLLTSAIKCPGHDCHFELDDDTVLSVIENRKDIKKKYQHMITNSFVLNNRLFKWCPAANCQNAIKLESFLLAQCAYFESTRCSCGAWFCFKCNGGSHDPVPCSMLIKWNEIRQEDLEVQNWILENTKQCPKCLVNIEKNGGCFHMTCRKCRNQFCWICMADWIGHHQNCRQKTLRHNHGITTARRFADYNARNEVMNQAYILDEQNYKHKISICELELGDQWIKNEFVSLAVETLLQCRRNLMHSYIFSYFMCTLDNQMFLFEENLKYLEQSTETLSEILEHDVTAENVHRMKRKIVDWTSLCNKRRRDLIDHAKEGWEKNWWRKFPIPADELVKAEIAMGDVAFENLLF